MNVGDKIYTKKFIATITEKLDNNMFGINFAHRKGNEYNYNVVSKKLIEDMISQKEWYLNNDPFSN